MEGQPLKNNKKWKKNISHATRKLTPHNLIADFEYDAVATLPHVFEIIDY